MPLAGPLRSIGRKHIEIASQWIPTATTFGLAGGFTVLYFTDWKLILQYVPFYNGKFKESE